MLLFRSEIPEEDFRHCCDVCKLVLSEGRVFDVHLLVFCSIRSEAKGASCRVDVLIDLAKQFLEFCGNKCFNC